MYKTVFMVISYDPLAHRYCVGDYFNFGESIKCLSVAKLLEEFEGFGWEFISHSYVSKAGYIQYIFKRSVQHVN